MKGEAGFTLLELMIAIGVLGLGVSLSVVAFRQMERTSLKRTALKVEDSLRRVAAEARRSGRDRTVTLETEPPRVCDRDSCLALPANITLSFVSAEEAGSSETRGRIVFLGGGGATGGELRLVNGSEEITMTIDWLSGRVIPER